MKKIEKHQTPACLGEYIKAQQSIQPEPVNLTYDCFPEKAALREILTGEQFGLCGYTGAPIDDRISNLKSSPSKAIFRNHIEHLKCQETCKRETESNGGKYGRDLCGDLDYFNMIAAINVIGSQSERFGAATKDNHDLPVWPIHEDCDTLFRFEESSGEVSGINAAAEMSIQLLKLDHDTLNGWRKAAIEEWLDPAVIQTHEDFENVKLAMEQPIKGKLPEYAFVIWLIVKGYLE